MSTSVHIAENHECWLRINITPSYSLAKKIGIGHSEHQELRMPLRDQKKRGAAKDCRADVKS